MSAKFTIDAKKISKQFLSMLNIVYGGKIKTKTVKNQLEFSGPTKTIERLHSDMLSIDANEIDYSFKKEKQQ